MPELPEVEIVKRSLQKSVYLRKILKVKVNNRNLRYKVDKNFEKKLKGKKILNISRKAKYITISLDDYTFFCIHLGMSGTLHIVKNKFENKKTNLSFYHSPVLGKKHNHLIFYFKDFKIIYNDPRRFGFIKIFENKRTFNNYFSRNGCEPLSKNFNLEFISHYGSIDTGIPLLVNYLDENTEYRSDCLGVPPDDFYDIQVSPTTNAIVGCQLWSEDRTLDDILYVEDNLYFLKGRVENANTVFDIPDDLDLDKFYQDTKLNMEQLRGHLKEIEKST